jgi:hypothetical protein
MKDREQKLTDLLENTKGEREVHRFLEEYPEILSRCLVSGGVPYMVSQFSLGSDYTADFVLVKGISGGLEVTMVELEPPDEPLFTQKGVAAERLNMASLQIEDWKRFVAGNRTYFYKCLSKEIQRKNLLANELNRGKAPTDSQLHSFAEVQDFASVRYVIVIGRSSTMTPEQQYRKATYLKDSFDIMTYDRLLETARECDRYHHIFEE